MSIPDPCSAEKASFVIISHFFTLSTDPKLKARWINDSLPLPECAHLAGEVKKMKSVTKCLKDNRDPASCASLIRDLNTCFCSSETVRAIVEHAANSLEPGFKVHGCVKKTDRNLSSGSQGKNRF